MQAYMASGCSLDTNWVTATKVLGMASSSRLQNWTTDIDGIRLQQQLHELENSHALHIENAHASTKLMTRRINKEEYHYYYFNNTAYY